MPSFGTGLDIGSLTSESETSIRHDLAPGRRICQTQQYCHSAATWRINTAASRQMIPGVKRGTTYRIKVGTSAATQLEERAELKV
jgi:hypothetical protein